MKVQVNTLTLLKAASPLLIVALLFIFVGQFGFGKISDLRSQLSDNQASQLVLTQKLDILRSISANGAQLSNLATTAMPDSNPLLAVMSQIKILAGSSGLALTDLKAGSPATDPTGLSSVSISFNISGSRPQVESFIKDISGIAPISVVSKVSIVQSSQADAQATLNIKSFWMPFPTKVPAVTQAISDLTPQEQQIMQSISSLKQPTFSNIQPSQGGKNDPFSQ